MIKKSKTSDFLVPWVVHQGKEMFVPWKIRPGAKKATVKLSTAPQGISLPVVWKPNEVFKASFKPATFPNGDSKIKMINTATDEPFWIRIAEFQDAFYKTTVLFGVFIGQWEIKQTLNTYYGLRMV